MTTTVRLAAVQMRWSAADYRSADAFAARVAELSRAAMAGADGPALVAFPELVGLPLLATAAGTADALDHGLARALVAWAVRSPGRWTRAAWRHRVGPLAGAYAALAPAAFALQRDAFAAAARATGATIVAGTALLPTVAFEAARGLHVVDPAPRNAALVFAPSGALIGRAAKAFLTSGLERRVGLRPGRVADLPVLATPVGRVAVAVCLDGWHHHVLERFDGMGAQVLVQPSANDAAWRRPWPPDPQRTEEDAWLELGLRAGIQGRASLRYGVNPMLVGDSRRSRPGVARRSSPASSRTPPTPCRAGARGSWRSRRPTIRRRSSRSTSPTRTVDARASKPRDADRGGADPARRPATSGAWASGRTPGSMPGVTGTLGLFSLVDLFQLLAASGRTGRLAVHHPLGRARVYFEKGQARHAEFGELEGEAAVDALFADERGTFAFTAGLPAPHATIEGSTEGLLLDVLRRADERRRDDPEGDAAPPRDAVPYASESAEPLTLPLAALERRVLAAVNGHWTAARIAQELDVEERSVRQVIGRLVQVGSLRLRARRPRTAQLVVRLASGRLPDGAVGVDAGIVRAWNETAGAAVRHVALRRADGRAIAVPLAPVDGAGPYLHVPRATLLRLDLRVDDALLARPHVPDPSESA